MEKSHSRATFGGRISAVLVTAGCGALGLGAVHCLDGRVRDLGELAAGLDTLQRELGWRLSPLPQGLEIISDMTLAPSGCMIETENGVYDCSLDTQLAELGRKLKLLSYERTPEGNR